MKPGRTILVVSIAINLLFVIGIAGVTGWKYYRKIKKPFRGDYYECKTSHHAALNEKRADIIFIGDSLTDRCEWSELFDRCGIINRGIEGDTTDGVLNRLDDITSMKPEKIFIMIGGADFIIGREIPRIEENYKKIIGQIRDKSPQTIIYIQSLLPTVQRIIPMPLELIRGLNGKLRLLADNRHVFYLDIYSVMIDSTGGLNPSYSIDGVHLNGQGYKVWREAIYPYIMR